MIMRKWTVVCTLLLLLLTGLNSARAKTWTLQGAERFSEGELDGASVLSTGEVVLAPPMQEIPGLRANYVWDISIAADGAAYVGTGSPAALYRWQQGKLEMLHETSEEHVHSVLALEDGVVLAATAPRGIIYRIAPDGQVSIFADLAAKYVWDMAAGPDGSIYCATGPDGRLMRLSAEGEAEEFFRMGKGNFMCLAVDREAGVVYAGTEPSGVIYRVTAEGEASVIYDAEESEVHALLLSQKGEIYAGTAGVDGQSQMSASRGPQQRPPSAPQAPAAGGGPGQRSGGKPTAPNSVYRIVPGQGGMRIARLQKAMALSLGLTGRNELLVGTGSDGRLVGVSDRGVTRVVSSFRAQHVSAIAADAKGRMLIGTANSGGLWQLLEGHRKAAGYKSKVFDAGYLSRWSRVEWKGDAPGKSSIRTALRTGNTRRPDETWSEWCEPVREPGGRAIEVPMGRFAQVRIDLTTEDSEVTPQLLQVSVSYRQANRRPQIQQLAINGQNGGQNGQKGRSPQRPGQGQGARPTMRMIAWKAQDPNGDELTFDLFYRGIEEKEWKELKTGIRGESKFQWDTRRVPDGYYLVRVVADDQVARAPAERLQMEKVIPPFVVDNGRPEVAELRHSERKDDGSFVLSGVVRDDGSPISRIQVSHNSGDWKPVFAGDGMFDSGEEKFDHRTEALRAGEHVFVFAATDARGNVGSEKIVLRVR